MIIIDPNSDINVFFGRMLVLVNELSFLKDGKKALTIERIVIYEFFSRSPLILAKVLNMVNKKINIDIKDIEVDGVNSLYPSYGDLYKFKNTKDLLQILFSHGLIDFTKESDGDHFISISPKGSEVSDTLESEYLLRIKEISKAIALLHSVSFSSLRTSVKSLLYE